MLRGASSVAGLLLIFLVGSDAHTALQKHLLRAAADCQMVKIPAADVRATHASFLETQSLTAIDPSLRPETVIHKPVASGRSDGSDSGSGSEEMGFDPDGDAWVPLKQQNGKPFNVLANKNKQPAPLEPSVEPAGQAKAPHAKITVKPCSDEPDCQGTPEPVGGGSSDPQDAAQGGPQIMFSDNDMTLIMQRMYAVSIQRILGGFDAANATCYCHFTDKQRTQLDFSEMNCLCRNRADKPLCRLEEIWAKYEHANLEGVISEARSHTTPEQEKFLDTNGTDMSMKLDGVSASKPGSNPMQCSSKPCKHQCMSRGVCLCAKCICEPGLSGDDCAVGLPPAMSKSASQMSGTAPVIKAPAGMLSEYTHPDHLVNILPNPLFHASSTSEFLEITEPLGTPDTGRRRLLAARGGN